MARDLIHNIIRKALENEGWTITQDPYPIKVGGFEMEIDLAAENLFAAERESEKIAVEIKSFAGVSKVYDGCRSICRLQDSASNPRTRENFVCRYNR
jgi:Holliday junction resolvase-like predicted endonuclease